MSRQELSDAIWAKMEPHLPGKASDPGRTGRDNRLFMEAILWLARTGAHWRALPEHFGNEHQAPLVRAPMRMNSIYVRFNRWCRDGVFDRLFNTMADNIDLNTSSCTAPLSGRIGIVRGRKFEGQSNCPVGIAKLSAAG